MPTPLTARRPEFPSAPAPDWVADAVFYQIFPERFANGDPSIDPPNTAPWDAAPTRENFLGGDLAGITARLDHVEALGANAIYLTPIFEAETNHRYDAVDYFRIDHRLGDLATFRTFLDQAHERGIRVVLDAVLNHCGIGHPYFQDVVATGPASPYVDFFSFGDFPVVSHPTPNYKTCSGCWYLPKWNVYHPAVREHHLGVATHWLREGIDGWRLDVPYFVTMDFWRRFREAVKRVAPNAYIVAEEWRDPSPWLAGDTADGAMNYTLRDLILGFTADGALDAHAFAAGLNGLAAKVGAAGTAMLGLIGSHDTERVLTRHGAREADARLAFALLFAAQGPPMVYYGDEVGMRGDNDPGCRAGMVWDETAWDLSTLHLVQDLAAARAAHPALRRGDQRAIALGVDAVAIVRRGPDESVATIVNRADRPLVVRTADLLPCATGLDSLLGRADGASRAAASDAHADSLGQITVPGKGAIILTGEEAGK